MFAFGVCSCGCLRVLVLVCLLGVVGQCGPAVLPRLALFACSRSGVGLLVCARLVRAWWVEGGQVGAGQCCPASCCVVLSGCCVCAEGGRGVWGAHAWCANMSVHAEGRGRGGLVGWVSGGLGGGCGWWRCARSLGVYNLLSR